VNSFEKIYNIVSKIPKGKVLTYKRISELSKINNPRVVGFALHNNKDIKNIPCHRVVSIKGELTGYAFGGIDRKKEILEKEGLNFLSNDRVDLDRHLFEI
jgi:methylated-DNA-protein-cysteine methyltransferase related protein